ncbi:MAG: transcription-repair coupling factor [Deltaproteobacteria bacterium]|nr:transcription-repair coupling factor [Deltaproteobacteria bacterium]
MEDLPRHLGGASALAGLPGGALAFAVSRIADRSTWLIVPSAEEAERLHAELGFYLGARRVRLFPADDVRPYDGLSPHPELPRARIGALYALDQGQRVVVVAPAAALIGLVLPAEVIRSGPELAAGQRLSPKALTVKLAELGYLAVSKVEDPGTFAARGDVVDLWPVGMEDPLRIELFDDEIESLRRLGDRQKTAITSLRVLPAREEVLGQAAVDRAARVLRELVGDRPEGAARRREVLEDLKAGIRFSGVDDYLPALAELRPPLSAGQGARKIILDPEACVVAVERALELRRSRFEALAPNDRPLVPPSLRCAPAAALLAELHAALPVLPLVMNGALDLGAKDNHSLRPEDGALDKTVARLKDWLKKGWRVGLVVYGSGRAERVKELLRPHELRPKELRAEEGRANHDPTRWPPGVLVLIQGDLPRGFHDPQARLAVIAGDELLGEKVRVRRGAAGDKALKDAAVTSFAQLKEGDLVVHTRHGVGAYRGLRRVDLGHGPEDMVQIEYRDRDLLYLPAYRLDQISRYSAVGGATEAQPRLDRLGGDTWALRKSKVKDEVLKLAHELIELQARRQVSPGHAYVGRPARFSQFEEGFPFTETPDQAAAIDAVLDDLALPEAMDRLIVGDVGFGKTEVAIRAAFRVVEEGHQVVLLCPTTVLAYQHAATLRERFKPFGHSVALLSRFDSGPESRAVHRQLAEGSLSVVVGTTRLLGRSLRCKRLGLVIVDEEHRFGVKQKEQLKRMREEVHYLAMSATPIPRSLSMALSGLRAISVINTPPQDRLSIHTSLVTRSDERVREDLLRELQRGGQALYIHHRVEDIEHLASSIRLLVPEARVEIAHGQLEDDALEERLVRFVERKVDVLVCTTIVESGLDMPNVNTILVHDAERYGLSQLYQLRGRVGRSHRRGYCTLMTQPERKLTREATQRLSVLQEHTALGSGFAIAAADLELRGAGNLLGERQHGQIRAVGFETYVSLLEDAMAEARGQAERERLDPEVDLRVTGLIPELWVRDTDERLALYRRLSSARTAEAIRRVVDDAESEHGEAPLEVLQLSRTLEIRCRCRKLGIARLAVLQVRATMDFVEPPAELESKLKSLCQSQPNRFKYVERRFEARFTPEEGQQPYLFIHWVLGLIEARPAVSVGAVGSAARG